MKKIFFIFYLLLTTLSGAAQSYTAQSDSTLTTIEGKLSSIEFYMRMKNGLNRYKLYPTENIYTFLKLDTMTGIIQQIQWSLDSENEGHVTINDDNLNPPFTLSRIGTFELYPTKNMYQFILLDTTRGCQWHVQWGFEESKRWIREF